MNSPVTPSQVIQNLASLKTEDRLEIWQYPDGYAVFVKNKTFKENDARPGQD